MLHKLTKKTRLRRLMSRKRGFPTARELTIRNRERKSRLRFTRTVESKHTECLHPRQVLSKSSGSIDKELGQLFRLNRSGNLLGVDFLLPYPFDVNERECRT